MRVVGNLSGMVGAALASAPPCRIADAAAEARAVLFLGAVQAPGDELAGSPGSSARGDAEEAAALARALRAGQVLYVLSSGEVALGSAAEGPRGRAGWGVNATGDTLPGSADFAAWRAGAEAHGETFQLAMLAREVAVVEAAAAMGSSNGSSSLAGAAPALRMLRLGTLLSPARRQRSLPAASATGAEPFPPPASPSAGRSLESTVCEAFATGVVRPSHPEAFFSALWLADLPALLGALLLAEPSLAAAAAAAAEPSPRLLDAAALAVASFSSSVGGWAIGIADATQGHALPRGHPRGKSNWRGFRLDTAPLEAALRAHPPPSLGAAANAWQPTSRDAAIRALLAAVPSLCAAPAVSPSAAALAAEGACAVCGSKALQPALDLGGSPPAALLHCPVCGHAQHSALSGAATVPAGGGGLAADAHPCAPLSLPAEVQPRDDAELVAVLAEHIALGGAAGRQGPPGASPEVPGPLSILDTTGTLLDAMAARGWTTLFPLEWAGTARGAAAVARGHAALVAGSSLDAVYTGDELALSAAPMRCLAAQAARARAPTGSPASASAAASPPTLYALIPQCGALPASGIFLASPAAAASAFSAHSLVHAAGAAGLVLLALSSLRPAAAGGSWRDGRDSLGPAAGAPSEMPPMPRWNAERRGNNTVYCLAALGQAAVADSNSNNSSNSNSNSSSNSARTSTANALLAATLREEAEHGLVGAGGYAPTRFAHAAGLARAWVSGRISDFLEQGYTVLAFGCTPAHAALLHALLLPAALGTVKFSGCVPCATEPAVAAGAVLAGTDIAVLARGGEGVAGLRRVAVLVLDWEHPAAALAALRGTEAADEGMPILLPLPRQVVLALDGRGVVWDKFVSPPPAAWELHSHEHRPPPWPLSLLPRGDHDIVAVMHQHNEMLIGPHFFFNAAGKFDAMVVLDYRSTDGTLEMAQELAPPSWEVRQSVNPAFGMQQCDQEVMDVEGAFPGAWRMAFTTTELLVHPDLRGMLRAWEQDVRAFSLASRGFFEETKVLYFRNAMSMGNNTLPLREWEPLAFQRNSVFLENAAEIILDCPWHPNNLPISRRGWGPYSRYMHRLEPGQYGYSGGRHFMANGVPQGWPTWTHLAHPAARSDPFQQAPLLAPHGYIAKFKYAPWPEVVLRKLDVFSADTQKEGFESAGEVVGEGAQLAEHKTMVARSVELELRAALLAPPAQTQRMPWLGEGLRRMHWDWHGVFGRGARYLQRRDVPGDFAGDAAAQAEYAALGLTYDAQCLTRSSCSCNESKMAQNDPRNTACDFFRTCCLTSCVT